MKDCWWSHDWTKWEQYEIKFEITKFIPAVMKEPLSGQTYEPWQKRKCLKCGFEQRVKI